MITETLTVRRGETDKYANPNKTDHGTVQGVFSWGTVNPSESPGGRGENVSTEAGLFVRRGTDLQAKDRVTRANGDRFTVVGGGQWDQNHPMTNRNFKWVAYKLKSM